MLRPCNQRGAAEQHMEYQDKVLKCAECSAEFVFTAGEQMFFADKGFKNEPKRCKACKAKRAETPDRAKATVSSEPKPKRPARSAGRRPRFPSSRRRAGPFSAANAFSSGGPWGLRPDHAVGVVTGTLGIPLARRPGHRNDLLGLCLSALSS